MIEQSIEARIIEQISAAIKAADIHDVAVWGAWQVDDAKAIETADYNGIVTVKVAPREYATPTIPHATFQATVAISVRAETDATSVLRLALADVVSARLFSWQDSFEAFAESFAGIDRVRPCGFTLAGGDVGFDRATTVWNYSHNFTINAVIA